MAIARINQHSYSCQDTIVYKPYTRLMSKINCPVKLPCFFDFQENRQRHTKLPEHLTV